MNIDRNENKSRIVDERSTVSPFFSITVDCKGLPLLAASVLNICVASSVCPFSNNHLGDSGIILQMKYSYVLYAITVQSFVKNL